MKMLIEEQGNMQNKVTVRQIETRRKCSVQILGTEGRRVLLYHSLNSRKKQESIYNTEIRIVFISTILNAS